MSKKANMLSGFSAHNAGMIFNCYSAVRIHARQPISGFCFRNNGRIENCMFRGFLHSGRKHLKSGLCAQQQGLMKDCFWLRGKQHQKAKEYTDWEYSYLQSDFSEETQIDFLSSWDLETTWFCNRGYFELYDCPSSPDINDNLVEIRSKEDLFAFAASINEGHISTQTVYRLTKDIDLGGCSWSPIGSDLHNAFNSIFDGNGHTIKNFRINAAKHPYAGFFGCTAKSASILNLTVDCIVTKTGNCAGPICGYNRGVIRNCIARAQLNISRYTGGFAGQNEGEISHSCALGRITPPVLIPGWLPLLFLLLLSLLISANFFLTAQRASPQEIFAPVIIDPNATPIPDSIPAPEPDRSENSNATFIVNAEMSVSTQNYAGSIGLRCPSWSNRGFVATVQISGKDLNALGIASEEQDYSLYQSGLIRPGYGIDVITLDTLPDGTQLPTGVYEFSVLFEFYNTETNEKSAINSTAPLHVTIH